MRNESSLPALFILSVTVCAVLGQFARARERTDLSFDNEVNLVRNPGFEQASHDEKRPKYWYPIHGLQSISSPATAEFGYALADADSGTRSASIESSEQVMEE